MLNRSGRMIPQLVSSCSHCLDNCAEGAYYATIKVEGFQERNIRIRGAHGHYSQVARRSLLVWFLAKAIPTLSSLFRLPAYHICET